MIKCGLNRADGMGEESEVSHTSELNKWQIMLCHIGKNS